MLLPTCKGDPIDLDFVLGRMLAKTLLPFSRLLVRVALNLCVADFVAGFHLLKEVLGRMGTIRS